MKNLTKIEAYVVVFRCSSCWETTERMQACVSQWLTITVCFSFWDCCEKIGFMKQKTNLTLKILAKKRDPFWTLVFCGFSAVSHIILIHKKFQVENFLAPTKYFSLLKKWNFVQIFFIIKFYLIIQFRLYAL